MKSFFFFGDSICVGQLVSPHKSWVHKCSEEMGRIDPSIVVSNCSVSGDTTRMALQRMHYNILQFGITNILIQFGINDCNLWKTMNGAPRVTEKGFEANLKEIIYLSELFGAKQIFLNTNHPIPVKHKFFTGQIFQERNAVYNQIIRDVAKEKNVILIDVEKAWRDINPEDYLLPDCIHLNDNGHEFYYEITREKIMSNIDR